MLRTQQVSRLLAVAILLGGLSAAIPPAFAADASTTTTTSTTSKHHKHHHNMQDMQQKVEDRIATLHTKLMITPEQEPAWDEVAKAMRDNETQIGGLIHERHMQGGAQTAVEDLESYQKIAQAHADGLKNVATSFSSLYDTMSDDQKANADKVFGGFEGHDHMKKDGKPSSKKDAATSSKMDSTPDDTSDSK